ncbi:hypothetical protein [Acinetobacter variabilis]|uniref:hypothetical protein n=1 Tax=Acinetobacter variabilis TaxID=70346 RepID=UPI003AF9483C
MRNENLEMVLKLFLNSKKAYAYDSKKLLSSIALKEVEELIEFFQTTENVKLHNLLELDHENNGLYTFDDLSIFFNLGSKAQLNKENYQTKGISIKLNEDQKQKLDFCAHNLDISRAKILEELVVSYSDSAYLNYLLGKHLQRGGQLNLENLIEELRTDAIELDEPNHVMWSLFKMRKISNDIENMAWQEFDRLNPQESMK